MNDLQVSEILWERIKPLIPKHVNHLKAVEDENESMTAPFSKPSSSSYAPVVNGKHSMPSASVPVRPHSHVTSRTVSVRLRGCLFSQVVILAVFKHCSRHGDEYHRFA